MASVPLPGVFAGLAPVLGHYGYAAVGTLVLLEDFGVPVPGETILIAAAVYAGAGQLNVVAVGLIALSAAILGDNIGYGLGRWGGRAVVLRFGRYVLLTPERLDTAEGWFQRHGSKVVVVARFIEGLRQANGWIAGITTMRWIRFTVFNAIGAAIWVGTWITIGYVSGSHIDIVYATISKYLIYLVILVALVLGVLLGRHLLRRHRASARDTDQSQHGPGRAHRWRVSLVTLVDRADRQQRRRSWLGFPLAVVYKFFDDRAPYLAALVTYYGFVSLFPLLLLFLSILGFILHGDASLRHDLVQSALNNFPVLGPRLHAAVSGFGGSGAALVVGVLGALYGAIGAMQAAQAGFNQIYGVPRNNQPNPFTSRLRSFALLGLLGTAVVLATAVSTLVSTGNAISAQFGVGVRIAGYALSFAINVGLFTAAVQLLTARPLRIRQVITGGLIAGTGWELLQTEGTRYISARLGHAGAVYGTFGVVLAAIAWIYLEALMLMLSAEVNVVLHLRLWPRALLTPFTDRVELTPADRRAYRMYAATQRFKGFQIITTDFPGPPAEDTEQPSGTPGEVSSTSEDNS